ncbi:anhydro-N-acetylmuramic acid kinase [Halomonas sp. DP8Y7-1]|uniref:anhydro-N-acetylmuramic acid kinase n=1 Tax=Halomonas sp. DP8Y7-1 TaxID=2859078 RepID=UPI001C96A251|nr:anhydro-N-acetylmuramic acid kinase [Halomonas sp. DP8Y7-1]MBY6028633.1 anhydro-N-acetylmuramic acid kinase [Halomonas sp. DP8Y7-1]
MQRFIGLMSGTSMDGIDAAMVHIDDQGEPSLEGSLGHPMPDALRRQLWQLAHADCVAFADLAAAEEAFCQCQAAAVSALLKQQGLGATDITAIGSHGQTIEHAPYGHVSGAPPYTLQLDNPSRLAELTQCSVVADFRRRDLAAGGQAAPLAPIFHQQVFRHDERWRLVLNLGGIANLTLLPPLTLQDAPLGFDTGPANALLDAWHERHHQQPFDAQGCWAAGGTVDTELLERWLAEPYFHQAPPRSTGRELFHLDWAESRLSGRETAQDVQATLAELTAASVAMGIEMVCQQLNAPRDIDLIPCGGGARNTDLMTRIERRLPQARVLDSEALGWPADWLEAAAFAWLAYARIEHLAGNLPSVTGASGARVLGGIYSR